MANAWQKFLYLLRGIAVLRESGLFHSRAQQHIAVVAEGVRAGIVQPAAARKSWLLQTGTKSTIHVIQHIEDSLIPS